MGKIIFPNLWVGGESSKPLKGVRSQEALGICSQLAEGRGQWLALSVHCRAQWGDQLFMGTGGYVA